MTQNSAQNPLIGPSSLKNQAIDFTRLKPEHFLPALEWAIGEAKTKIEKIKSNPKPSFANTIEALELATEDADLVASTFYNLLSAEATEEIQKLADQFGPKLSEFSSDLTLDPQLFMQIKTAYETTDLDKLDVEEKQLLQNTYDDFARNGALLDDNKKNKLREIDQNLSKIAPKFSENILKATNVFELWINDKNDLKGLPDSAVQMAQHEAEAKGRKGEWLFTLQAPSIMPFLTYADRRDLREKMWRAYNTRCVSGELDNREIVLKIVRLRHARAQLLGFKTHADFTLQKRMAETASGVNKFLEKLLGASKAAGERELKELEQMAKELNIALPIQPWDSAYLTEKLKIKKYNFDQEQLRPYFKLENVIAGVFKHAEMLFGLEFKRVKDYPTYHSDIEVYEVFRNGGKEFVGVFYTDFFPRPTKRDGAWMSTLHEQGLFRGQVMRPHVTITCNFTKSTKEKPSLLSFNEVLTLFHEFGHALHGLLSKCRYQCLGGTNVYWDFVELPSQILENWAYEKESLDLFARHYQTGETIPIELTRKIKESSQFMAGTMSLRQLQFGLLDMAWHTHAQPDQITDVLAFEKQATSRTRLLPYIEGTNNSCSFGHIFSGGYSAGYYSYKWAEVLDADAFEYFKEKGLFNREVADLYRTHILERGGTEHPSDLYRRFRGRDPDPNALLRREGLLQ